MILQRLVDLYDRIAGDPATADALPKSGYSLQKCSFCVVLNNDGTLNQFESLLDTGKKKPIPRLLLVPGQAKPSGSGINPCFLWDNAAYMLGFKADDAKPKRTREAFEAFREKHLQIQDEIDSRAFTAVCAFLKQWSPELAAEHPELAELAGSFGVFRLAAQRRFVHDDPEVVAYWAGHGGVAEGEASPPALCLVTGKQEPIARLHEPKIKGVLGTQSAGALLVSFNSDAYTSFGRDQGDNAPVGETAAFKYTNALNHLLNRSDRRLTLGDMTVVFWAERPTPVEEFAGGLFGDYLPPDDDLPADDREKVRQARLFVSQLRDGFAAGDAFADDNQTQFYVLGLSPNASRISVRFWVQTDVAEMKRRLMRHLADVELIGARDDELLLIRRMVSATGRAEVDPKGHVKSYDADSVSPLLAGAVARAVLTGNPYPRTLLGSMINRLRADGAITHPRVAAIKAVLVRNNRERFSEKEALVSLDTSRGDPPYVTGRLFALLERIQQDASGGDLNSTIKDRYFSAASATPGAIFPRLIRLSQHHLSNLGKEKAGLKVNHDKLCGEIMGKLDNFASNFDLEAQGLFAVGYYHQRQAFYTSKKSKEEGDSQ